MQTPSWRWLRLNEIVAVVKRMKVYGVRSYIPEKNQKGRWNWAGKSAEQQAV